MRRLAPWILLVGLAGCTPSPKTEPVATTPPPIANSNPTPAPAAPIPGKPVEAELTSAQLTPFFTKLGAKMGHGGLPKEAIASTIDAIKKIKPGPKETGTLHMDHEGSHENVTMTVQVTEKGTFRLSFADGSQNLLDSIKAMLP